MMDLYDWKDMTCTVPGYEPICTEDTEEVWLVRRDILQEHGEQPNELPEDDDAWMG